MKCLFPQILDCEHRHYRAVHLVSLSVGSHSLTVAL